MEVHAHSHTERKKWTHYFWEFLMLFLAVTLGFFVENQREHMVEHEREKQFIRSLIADLELDSTGLAKSIGYKKEKQQNIDSVLYPLTKLKENNLPLANCITLYNIPGKPYFFSNNGTIQQLKGSGGMRLIRNRQAVDSIEAYDFQIRRIMLRQEQINSFTDHELGKVMNNFIPSKAFFEERYDSLYQEKNYDPKKIIKINSAYLNELINQLMTIRDNNSYEITLFFTVKNKAENIIRFLRQEYKLK